LTIVIKALQQMFEILIHEWDTLVKNIGKQMANVLLAYIALGILFEVFWFTLMISLLVMTFFLD